MKTLRMTPADRAIADFATGTFYEVGVRSETLAALRTLAVTILYIGFDADPKRIARMERVIAKGGYAHASVQAGGPTVTEPIGMLRCHVDALDGLSEHLTHKPVILCHGEGIEARARQLGYRVLNLDHSPAANCGRGEYLLT